MRSSFWDVIIRKCLVMTSFCRSAGQIMVLHLSWRDVGFGIPSEIRSMIKEHSGSLAFPVRQELGSFGMA